MAGQGKSDLRDVQQPTALSRQTRPDTGTKDTSDFVAAVYRHSDQSSGQGPQARVEEWLKGVKAASSIPDIETCSTYANRESSHTPNSDSRDTEQSKEAGSCPVKRIKELGKQVFDIYTDLDALNSDSRNTEKPAEKSKVTDSRPLKDITKKVLNSDEVVAQFEAQFRKRVQKAQNSELKTSEENSGTDLATDEENRDFREKMLTQQEKLHERDKKLDKQMEYQLGHRLQDVIDNWRVVPTNPIYHMLPDFNLEREAQDLVAHLPEPQRTEQLAYERERIRDREEERRRRQQDGYQGYNRQPPPRQGELMGSRGQGLLDAGVVSAITAANARDARDARRDAGNTSVDARRGNYEDALARYDRDARQAANAVIDDNNARYGRNARQAADVDHYYANEANAARSASYDIIATIASDNARIARGQDR